LHGVGLNELLADAQAPKGVLYHHFPGGKQALAVAAIEETSAHLNRSLDTLIARKADPVEALRQWLQASLSHLQASGFERGCPLATVALETSPGDAALRAALADAFAALRGRVALLLQADGRLRPERAQGLAALIVSTYEGALMQARVAADPGPMLASADTLLSLIQAERETASPPAGGPSA
jgi:TetR/AcrR family transcriptional regulator, lmrAB and yxaGH operons repressor